MSFSQVLNFGGNLWGNFCEPSGQNRQKTVVFVNLALKVQCHMVKNTLLQTAFSVKINTL